MHACCFIYMCSYIFIYIIRSLIRSMSVSLHSFWQGTLFVYYYNSARSFRYHFLFCSCKSDVGLFRFVSFRLCWKGDIVQHISTWNNFWRAVFMRLCASKSVFSILQNCACFLLVKIFIKHFKRRYRALSLQGSRNGLFAMKLWQILLPAQHYYFTSQFGNFWERKIMPKLLCLYCMYLASFFLYLLLLVKSFFFFSNILSMLGISVSLPFSLPFGINCIRNLIWKRLKI